MTNPTEVALRAVVADLEKVVAEIRAEADRRGIAPEAMRDAQGGLLLAQPLSALAFAYVALRPLPWP